MKESAFTASLGDNSVAVKVGGAEVHVTVSGGVLIIDVSSPGELDPAVFDLNPRFGTATVVFRKDGYAFSYKDLHSHDSA